MKNTQQKVIAIFYLLVIIGLSFFAPKYSNYSNNLEFGSIWTNKVDWFKFGYIFFLISLFFILLFYFYRNKSNPDVNSPSFKRIVKREIKVFVFGVLAFATFWGFIEIFNMYQENRKDKISSQIDDLDFELSDYRKKLKNQEEFMEIMDETFNLVNYDGSVKTFFESWVKKSENPDWLKYIESELKKNTYSIKKGLYNYIITKKEATAFLRENPKAKKISPILTAEYLKDVLDKNNISKLEQNNVNEKIKKIEELKSEKEKLFFFVRDGYTKSILLFLAIEFLVLYILRFGFYGVRSLNNYLKEN